MTRTHHAGSILFAIMPLLIVGCSKPTGQPKAADTVTMTASELLDMVTATYKSMETYKSAGTITTDIETGSSGSSLKTSFSILLKKPNLYLISWTQKNMPLAGMAQAGTVWSDGTQPYLHMSMMNAYAPLRNDETALSSATGISGGAAFTIPSLFFSVFDEHSDPFSRLITPKIIKSENVGGEDCYVIGGQSSISRNESIWVSKKTYLIKKCHRSLEPPEGGIVLPELTDEELEKAMKAVGQELTEENKRSMKEMMMKSQDTLKTASLKGSSTETHVDISTPEATTNEFQFTPPKGSILKESLFGNILGGDI